MDDKLKERYEKLISGRRVFLFMKGTPAEPRCGFSAKAVAILTELSADYGTFDVLSDPAMREAVKGLSGWPTYPQLYVDGKLVGGSDIIEEMAESGELAKLLEEKHTEATA